MSSSLLHCMEEWLFRDVQKDTWRVFRCHGSVTSSQHGDDGLKMTIITWRQAVSAHHPFSQGVTLLCWCIRLIHRTLRVILSLQAQLMQTAERVDMRGNRGGRYIASLDILIGLSKSLPPFPPPSSVFHHSHTNNGLSALIPLWTGRSIGIGFYLSWGGWRRAAIGREGERRRWMEREQLRLC